LGRVGKPDRALVDIEAVLSKSPQSAAAHSMRGYIRLWKGQLDPALDDFSEAIRLDPKDLYSRYQRGMIYHQKAEYAKALGEFDEVIRVAPESPASASAYEKRASIRAGCPDARFRDGRLALESASKACQLTASQDAECLTSLAMAHAELGDNEAAAAAMDKAIALLKPGDPRLESCQSMREVFRGNSFIRLGDLEKYLPR
jgi:tetratricopeptide (TPR) repeat protein